MLGECSGMDGITVRAACPGDVAGLAALVERAYAAYLPLLDRRPAPMDDNYLARQAAGELFAARLGAVLVGALVLVDEPGGVLLLDNIAVDPAWQGAGVGRAMLRWVDEEAARRGCAAVRLYTHEKMVRNIALYERAGFAETHRLEDDGRRRVFMAKRAGRSAPGFKPR